MAFSVGVHADPINHQIPGGIGVYVRRLVEHLLQSEDAEAIRLLAVKPVPSDPAEWWKPNWWKPPRPFASLPYRLLYASWNYLSFPKVGASLDAVHATGPVIPPAPGAALVATVHDVAVDTMPEVVPGAWRRIYSKGLHLALERAEVLCTVSQAVKTQLVSEYSVSPQRVIVTPEAPNVTPDAYRDDAWLDRMGLDTDFILNVGTVEPRKNQGVLLRAFAEAEPKLYGMKLVIAGAAGWGSENVRRAVEELGISERVVLTGSVGASALASLYGRARVFAMPSLYEGFGIPLLEAMGFGVPAVASPDPALKEVGGAAALSRDFNDTSAWADALIQLHTDEDLRTRLTAAGVERASAFSWQQTCRETLKAYHRAAQ